MIEKSRREKSNFYNYYTSLMNEQYAFLESIVKEKWSLPGYPTLVILTSH